MVDRYKLFSAISDGLGITPTEGQVDDLLTMLDKNNFMIISKRTHKPTIRGDMDQKITAQTSLKIVNNHRKPKSHAELAAKTIMHDIFDRAWIKYKFQKLPSDIIKEMESTWQLYIEESIKVDLNQ